MRLATLALTLACGCSAQQARRVHRAGEIATATGLIGMLGSVTAASVFSSHEDTLISVGVAFVPVALFGALLFIGTDHLVDAPHGPTLTRRERHRLTAWELTKQAAGAARERDCTQVQAIAPRVRDLDHELHVEVFMRDVAIQRCLRER